MINQVWRCGSCSEAHDWEDDALTCCAPEPEEAWECKDCEEVHKQKNEALNCCGEKVRCPKCMRPHSEKSLNGVSVRVVGFCNVCTPAYSYDQQDRVEEAFHSETGRICNVLTGAVI